MAASCTTDEWFEISPTGKRTPTAKPEPPKNGVKGKVRMGDTFGHDFVSKISKNTTLTEGEKKIAEEAYQILNSEDFIKIIEAQKNKQDGVQIRINNRTISYDDAPFSGMTWFEENGFNIGREAFVSEMELVKTVLHELHRLTTSKLRGMGSAVEVSNETKNAFNFAEKAYELFD